MSSNQDFGELSFLMFQKCLIQLFFSNVHVILISCPCICSYMFCATWLSSTVTWMQYHLHHSIGQVELSLETNLYFDIEGALFPEIYIQHQLQYQISLYLLDIAEFQMCSWHKIHFSQSNIIVKFDDEDSMSGFTILMCLDISYQKITLLHFLNHLPSKIYNIL